MAKIIPLTLALGVVPIATDILCSMTPSPVSLDDIQAPLTL
jgi:hypothetical protein